MIPGPLTACHTISPAIADDDSFSDEADDEGDEEEEDDDEEDEEVEEADEDLSEINVNRQCELPFVFLQ